MCGIHLNNNSICNSDYFLEVLNLFHITNDDLIEMCSTNERQRRSVLDINAEKNTYTKKTAKSSALSNQLIWPYSDFLLHDMGDELGDNLNENMASGNEWRTPPLWGIGLAKNVNGQINLLHDGRAKSILAVSYTHLTLPTSDLV